MGFEIAKAPEEGKKLEQQPTQVSEGYERLISVKNSEDVDDIVSFEDDDKALKFKEVAQVEDEHRHRRSSNQVIISPDKIGDVTVSTYAGDVTKKEEKVETLKLIGDREKKEDSKKRRSRGDQSHEDTNVRKDEFAGDWDLHDSTSKPGTGRLGDGTPAPKRHRSRWDDTPVAVNSAVQFDFVKELPGGLLWMKLEDYEYFGSFLKEEDEVQQMSPEELKEHEIMKLLLKVKCGTPPQRETALTQLTDKAREFGPDPLLTRIGQLLMQPSLEDDERHILVKLIDRLVCKLDELVRPVVHKILVPIEPLLIDEDYNTRVQGREIISNLSKAVGLNAMIDEMLPDFDNIDEHVRNATASAFSVVASTLGIPALLPFLKDVCQSHKSWQARYTGIKIVQQIALLIGGEALPHLRSLVEIIQHGLNDENQEVRTITGLSLAALAKSSAPPPA